MATDHQRSDVKTLRGQARQERQEGGAGLGGRGDFGHRKGRRVEAAALSADDRVSDQHQQRVGKQDAFGGRDGVPAPGVWPSLRAGPIRSGYGRS